KLGLSDGTVKEFTDSVLPATSSSRYPVPMYWPDPKTGIGFQVQVEIPLGELRSAEDVGVLMIHGNNGNGSGPPLRVQDIAQISKNRMPGEYDRYNMRRLVSITANIQGEDLGRVADEISRALKEVGDPPRGFQVDVRGQVVPMREMFGGLALGLLLAGCAIFLLLTAYFQSPRLALVAVSSVPAVLAGVALALLVTRTTLNLQSFMGAIMALGVAV